MLIATFATLFISAGFVTSGELLAGNVYRGAVPVQPVAPMSIAPPVVVPAPVAPAEAPPAPEAAPTRRRRWARLPVRPRTPAEPKLEPTEPVAPLQVAAAPAATADEGATIGDIAQAVRESGEMTRRIAVVGAAPNAGTTSTAVALARALAKDKRVVLVDLALERPTIAAIATEARTPGVAELVRGTASFAQIITRDRYSRVQIIPAGRVAGDAAMIFMSERLRVAIDALSRTYDHVIIDAGAAPYIPAHQIAKLAPCAVMVAAGVPAADAEAVRGALANSGFSDVAMFTGTVPAPDAAGSHGVAA